MNATQKEARTMSHTPELMTPLEQARFNQGYMTAIEKFDCTRLNPAAYRAVVEALRTLVDANRGHVGMSEEMQTWMRTAKQALALAEQP